MRLALVLLLWPCMAWADPVSLLSAVTYYGLTALGSAYAGLIAFGVALVAGAATASRARRKARDAFNASLVDRTITVRGATEPRRMVLGRQRVGGVVAFIASTGVNREWMVVVSALAAHECDGIEQIFFNDEPVDIVDEWVQTPPYARVDAVSAQDSFTNSGTTYTLAHTPIAGTVAASVSLGGGENGQQDMALGVTSVSGNVVTLSADPGQGFVITYQWAQTVSFARVRTFLGAAGQTVDSVVNGLFPGEWDSTHPMSGCAGVAVFLNFNEDAFQTEVQVSAVMRGAKCYDPRLDSTAGGSGPHRLADPTTWEFTENPALQIGYAAMSPLCGRQASTAVNWLDVATAANVCDTPVDYTAWATLTVSGADAGPLTDDDDDAIRVTLPRDPDRSLSL